MGEAISFFMVDLIPHYLRFYFSISEQLSKNSESPRVGVNYLSFVEGNNIDIACTLILLFDDNGIHMLY